MIRVYWQNLQSIEIDESKWDAKLHGFETKGIPLDRMSEHEAREFLSDPMKLFPNDVDYTPYDSEYAAFKRREYRAFVKKHSRPPTDDECLSLKLWEPARIEALEGEHTPARRACMNGELWLIYKELSRFGPATFDDLKRVIATDFALAKMLPSVAEVQVYNVGRKEPVRLQQDGIHLVPACHIEKHMAAGTWAKLLADVKAYGGVNVPEKP